MSTDALHVLFCHGFGSSPASSKARAIRAHLSERGVSIDALDLRVPDRDRLRLSAMIATVQEAIPQRGSVLAIGSSLGGLTVARAAERDPRIVACLLLAPAFLLVERWRARLGEESWARWQQLGSMAYDDYATGGQMHVDFGFIEDAAVTDVGWPDVKVPTTIVHGTRDDVVDIWSSRRFAQDRPHVNLIEVDDDHQLLGSLPRILMEIDRIRAETHPR